MNICPTCGADFGSPYAFDQHRVGKHAYAFSIIDEAHADGRRCLAASEMRDSGFILDRNGRWRTAPPPRRRPLRHAPGR